MSQGIHFVSSNIPGYGPAEGKCLCSGVSGRAVTVSSYTSRGDFKPFPLVKNVLLKNPVLVSKRTSPFVCTASSSGNRRNSDFSRQNKQNTWFPRNKNKQNHDRDNFENLEDSELLSSENGPGFSVSRSPMYKATATPGPKEKEIVELFRKVQVQLRERAALREKKTEAPEGQSQENETVESLLKLLRKHSAEQGKEKSSSSNNIGSSSDSVIEQPDQNTPFDEEETTGLFNSNNSATLEAQKSNPKPFKRPVSNFRRKSPVPRVKFQPVYTAENDIGSNSSLNSKGKRKNKVEPEPEPEPELELELDSDSESESESELMLEPEVHDEVFAESSEFESESSDIDEVVETDTTSTQQADLSGLKVSDLRVLAKSRGLKGYSKMKKSELVELLSG